MIGNRLLAAPRLMRAWIFAWVERRVDRKESETAPGISVSEG